MDNKAKIYTLYFALSDTINLICNIANDREDAKEKLDSEQLFHKFLDRAKNQYSDLRYDLVAEIGASNYKAEEEFGRLASGIKRLLGNLENERNCALVFILWIAFNLTWVFYYSNCVNQEKLVYDLEERVRLGYQKYLSLSQSNSPSWLNTDSIIKSKLGNF